LGVLKTSEIDKTRDRLIEETEALIYDERIRREDSIKEKGNP
jgi:hypothetical protein